MTDKTYTSPSEKTLGAALPASAHAVSVSLPKWADVVGYEENDPRVINSLTAGYPRFTINPITQRLFDKCREEFASEGQDCIVLPSKKSALECKDYITNHCNCVATIREFKPHRIFVITFDESAKEIAHNFWQHSGLIISSRQAEDVFNLEKNTGNLKEKTFIIKRLSDISKLPYEDIFLYGSGMSALYAAHRAISKRTPNANTIQLGFAYVDSIKLQQRFGSNCHIICDTQNHLKQIEEILQREKISAVFCEIPSNPELRTIDIASVSALLKKHRIPLIIDDTVAAWQLDVSPYADIIATSLTKYFSGASDVLAGSLITNPHSPLHDELEELITEDYEDLLYSKDAEVLAENCKDFEQRVAKININTQNLVAALSEFKAIEQIFYPSLIDKALYDFIRTKSGGYGGLFSIVFKDPAHAPIVYDALNICKGPSLGTNFTLACPYILLAHYHELKTVEEYGIAAELIRVSVGLEDLDETIADFIQALAKIA